MLYNYLNIALRNLLKNKVYTLINILGLALGIASVFLIGLYIQRELSYDRFHHQPENLYRITWEDENPQTRTPHPLAQALVNDFPEVESAVSLSPLWAAGLTRETHSFRNLESDKRFDETNILSVDTTFFEVFDFPLIAGDAKTALKKINGVLLSESMARKYFGDENSIGKQLAVDSDTYMVEVVGVFKDVPVNSHFHFDFLVSYIREKSFDANDPYYSWSDFGHYNYVRLKPGVDPLALQAKLMSWLRKYIPISDEQFEGFSRSNFGLKVQPVTDIHLNSRLRWELEPNGNIEYVYILAAAALLTLVIACVNFMNLSTARSAERAKEIGIRKTIGALRSQLSLQFLAESITVSLLAVVLSIFIIETALPFFNYVTGLSFQVDYQKHLLILIGFGIIIGAVSGLYPALYLSRVKTNEILKGKLVQSPRGAGFRKGLIVFQFSISMILISAATIVFSQLSFIKEKDLGFSKEEVIVIPVKNESGFEQFQTLKNELLKIEGVLQASAASNIPGRQFNQHTITATAFPENEVSSSEAYVDFDFFNTLDIQLTEGRFFAPENISDSSRTFILNETAARQLFFEESAVGREIMWHRDEDVIRGTVIGVVRDFHFQSLHEPIRPFLFTLTTRAFNHILVKARTDNFQERLDAIEKGYKRAQPYFAFEFHFLEDQLEEQYAPEERTANILGTFSIIAIAIACFGLFAMSMLTFQQKLKEISVRKVLGASSLSLLTLLVGGFTRLIIVAILVGTPLSWWIMEGWLNNFTYQVGIHPMVFLASGLMLLAISWVTLGYFTVKASGVNPAETLKNE